MIGAGNWAVNRVRHFKEIEGCRVALGWSRSEKSRHRFREEIGAPVTDDWREVCQSEQVDAVNISTPHVFHFEQARAALANGKHVIVETPLSLHYSQAQELAESAAAQGLVIHHSIQGRYHPDHSQEIENLRAAGPLVYTEKTNNFEGGPERPWYRDFDLSGGGFSFLSYVALDFFEAFGPVEEVDGKHVRRGKLDIATLWVGFRRGGQAKITFGTGEDITGVSAGLVIGLEGAVQWGMGLPMRLTKGEKTVDLPQPRQLDTMLVECQAFVDEIRGERDFRPELELDLQILKAVSEAQEKAKRALEE